MSRLFRTAIALFTAAAVTAAEPVALFSLDAGAQQTTFTNRATAGLLFQTTRPLAVTAVGMRMPSTQQDARYWVRVYQADTQELLFREVIVPAQSKPRDGFVYAQLPAPAALPPGKYQLCITAPVANTIPFIITPAVPHAGNEDIRILESWWDENEYAYPWKAFTQDKSPAYLLGANLLCAPSTQQPATPPVIGLPPPPPLGEPANPNASPAARALLKRFHELPQQKEKRILSGQFAGWYPLLSLEPFYLIHKQTGQWPAVAGFDYYETYTATIPVPPDTYKLPRWQYINELIKIYSGMGGLVTISLHSTNPWTGGLAWDKTLDFEDLFDPATPAAKEYRRQIDAVADGLADLQQAGVTVLFRPFHEMTNPFWWGRQSSAGFCRLWRELFDYYTHVRKLNNLIWVWSPLCDGNPMRYYPGGAYVDMTGLDVYSDTLTVARDTYNKILAAAPNKPFALTEFGPFSGHNFGKESGYDYARLVDEITNNLPRCVYFLAWRDAKGIHRNPNSRGLMLHPLVGNIAAPAAQ